MRKNPKPAPEPEESNEEKYPRISVRVRKEKKKRMSKLRDKSNLSYGQIVDQCLDDHMPVLEKFHGVV